MKQLWKILLGVIGIAFIGYRAVLLTIDFFNTDLPVDVWINNKVEPVTNFINSVIFVQFDFTVGENVISIPIVLIWLVMGALFCTLYFRFANVRFFKMAIDIVRGKYSDPNEKGEVSHFQALTTAFSATVGLGNIAGVAVAISLGGAGATFWMIVVGLLGMSSKFTECTLGVKYRTVDADGTVHGGPMHYLRKGFKDLSMVISSNTQSYEKMGKVLAGIFAVACIGGSFGGGNMFQVNQAYKQFSGVFMETQGWVFGLIMAFFVGIIIIGGIKSIARVTDKIVPFMVVIYVVAALVVLGVNYKEIPNGLYLIFTGAFTMKAGIGGLIGVMIQGVQRAAFSNEAGIGSASIAHSAVKTDHPASEGLVALLEPFIDTVVICTMTALVIVITDQYYTIPGMDSTTMGVTLTSRSFATVIDWFPYVLTVAVILFALSTMISWSYYGLQAWEYLFGTSKIAEYSYKSLFCIMVVVGAAAEMKNVLDFSDAMIFMMCFPNMIGLVFLAPVVKNELNSYLAKIKSGEIVTQK